MTKSDILHIDNQHIWHPYASAVNPLTPFIITQAKGVYLYTDEGKKLIDGMSSWWSVIHGYNNPLLNNAACKQLESMAHVMFGGLTHEPAAALTKSLLAIIPAHLTRVFYSDSGSVAVEVALKMAIQYWHAQGKPTKQKFITIRGGYHGDTWHAMSVCDPETGMHALFSGALPQQFFVPRPSSTYGSTWNPQDIVPFEEMCAAHHSEIAGFIFEPIVQGAGGMYFYHPQFLQEAERICKKYDILCIADEIATGFGRTGNMFACEHAHIEPDILCVGKAITGGYMSFAATVCTHEIAAGISHASPGVFMHGPTFMANPLACAIAHTSIGLLCSSDWKQKIATIEQQLQSLLHPFASQESVADVRVIGAIGVIEMKEAVDMKSIQPRFVENGVWVRPFGKLVYIMPPYIISKEELEELVAGIAKTLFTNR